MRFERWDKRGRLVNSYGRQVLIVAVMLSWAVVALSFARF